ncbi:MAG: hypothetical protein AB3N16_03860, partial [Flavobacteriaceae bacterium]
LATLLIDTYPDGYGDDDIIMFKNAKGEMIEAVELQTADIIYLVKISKKLSHFIATFDDTIEREQDTTPAADSMQEETTASNEMETISEPDVDEE